MPMTYYVLGFGAVVAVLLLAKYWEHISDGAGLAKDLFLNLINPTDYR